MKVQENYTGEILEGTPLEIDIQIEELMGLFPEEQLSFTILEGEED